MKKILASTLLLVFIILGVLYAKHRYFDPRYRLNSTNEEVKRLIDKDEIRDGDIIFQTSLSRQSGAIQLATHSQYSHCGIIYKTGNSYFVFEAVQPVKLTPLNKWIAKGKDGHFVIKRLKDSSNILTPAAIKKLKHEGQIFKGKNYDIYFDWSDDKIYCSELIWKVYDRALGIQIGKLQKLKDFDLSDPTVKQIMYQRYGNKVPLDETVISPVSMFNSELLQTVVSN